MLIFLVGLATPRPVKKYKRRPNLRTAEPPLPRPNQRVEEAWDIQMCEVSELAQNLGEQRNPLIERFRGAGLWPQLRTERDHVHRRRRLGHLRWYRRTGNFRGTVFCGRDLVNLAYFRILYPKGRASEANVFLWNAGGRRRFYHPSQITRAEDMIGLSRKRGSTTAEQAMLPRNVMLRWAFWNLPYPWGIADVRRQDLIDLDEAGLFVETANRSTGKARFRRRVRETGPYGHSQKLNILFAISGADPEPGRSAERWVDMWYEGGTTVHRFLRFICRILSRIGRGNPARRRTFIMDNLCSHR